MAKLDRVASAIGIEDHQYGNQEPVWLTSNLPQTTSLFVLGYAVGPCVFAPISELYGRRLPIIFAA